MANQRLFLKCDHCGATYFLAKRMASGYYHSVSDTWADRLNEWFDEHRWGECKPDGNTESSLDHFSVEYEIDKNYDMKAAR